MTPTEIASASKTRLTAYIAELQEAQAKTQQDLNQAVSYANYFGSVLSNIEQLLMNSPFVNKEGKFFKTLFWVMSNLSVIKKLIEDIISHVKQWRSEVNKVLEQQKKAVEAAPTV